MNLLVNDDLFQLMMYTVIRKAGLYSFKEIVKNARTFVLGGH